MAKYNVQKKAASRSKVTVENTIDEESADPVAAAVLKADSQEQRGPCSFSGTSLIQLRGEGPREGQRPRKGTKRVTSIPRTGRMPPKGELRVTSNRGIQADRNRNPDTCNPSHDYEPVKVHNCFSCLSVLSVDKANIDKTNTTEPPFGKKSRSKPKPTKPEINKHNLVVNLSNKTLSQSEMSILEKGLKFCPMTKRVNDGEDRRDLDTFHNKVRTIHSFQKEQKGSKITETTTTTTTTATVDLPFSDVNSLRKLKEKSNWKALRARQHSKHSLT